MEIEALELVDDVLVLEVKDALVLEEDDALMLEVGNTLVLEADDVLVLEPDAMLVGPDASDVSLADADVVSIELELDNGAVLLVMEDIALSAAVEEIGVGNTAITLLVETGLDAEEVAAMTLLDCDST